MPIDLDKLERLEREATPGPWAGGNAFDVFTDDDAARRGEPGTHIAHTDPSQDKEFDKGRADRDLIVALRNAAPAMVRELRTLRTRVVELEEENERLRAKLEDIDRIGRDALRKGGHPTPDDWDAAYAIGWLEARNDREFRVTQAQREAAIYGAAWAENARFYNAKIIDPVECAAAASEAAEKAVEFWRAAQKQTEKETEK